MVKKIWPAAAMVLCMFSVPSPAAPIQDCYKWLSAAQLEVWQQISLGTAQQCKIEEAYAANKISWATYNNQSNENYWNVGNKIDGIENNLNNTLESKGCNYYPYYYGIDLDTWGYGDGFEFVYLCFEGSQETE